MRTYILILWASCLVSPLAGQNNLEYRVTLNSTSVTVNELIREIQSQTAFRFSYGSTLPLTKVVKTSPSMTVLEIVKKIAQETGVNYEVKEYKIILKPAPKKRTISGYLRDEASGESLIGGNVYTSPGLTGAVTNSYGYYSLTLYADSITLVYSYVGYVTKKLKFVLEKDTVINISLPAQMLNEVVVQASNNLAPDITKIGTVNVSIQKIKELPALLGEVDVLKTLSLLPGVQSGNEGSSGIYVRGGGPDQNLILLDNVPVYNASHLFGFFSVFNADAINHVELIKGGFPARYGGRLSSVIDISMKDGNNRKVKGEGSIGIISSKFSLEGPIQKDKSSFIISARRTYADLIARPFMKKNRVSGYYFYDVNAKINHAINNKNRVYLSFYGGNDKVYSKDKTTTSVNDFGLFWGNVIAAARWNHVISPKLFSNVTATYSRYHFEVYNTLKSKVTVPINNSFSSKYFSGIEDVALKIDFDFAPNPNHSLRFGANSIHHVFVPGAINQQLSVDTEPVVIANRERATELSAYIEDDMTIIQSFLNANVGVHLSGFQVKDKFYTSIQPRLAAGMQLTERLALKTSYASMTQYVHLLTNSGVGLPTDLWVPATDQIAPQQSQQVTLGIHHLFNKSYEWSIESYYKTMENVIEYSDGAGFTNTEDSWEDKVSVGKGEGYGSELLIQKKEGKVTGWIGYTLSWAYRQFDEISWGRKFPYKYDNRHDLNIAFTHQWNERMDFSMVWAFTSGNAVSLPTERYESDDPYSEDVIYYEGRNNFRMRDYHRLDLSVSFSKKRKWGERKWSFGLYNAYNRKNPFFMYFGGSESGTGKLWEVTLFPIIPSFSYSYKF